MSAFLLGRPKLLLVMSILFLIACAAGLPRLVKDPTTDSLIPVGDPSNESRKLINGTFGLRDPMIVGLSTEDGSSIFTEPGIKNLIYLQNLVKEQANVRSDRVKSLVSEISISGSGEEVSANNFVTDFDTYSPEIPAGIRARIAQTPVVQNGLISGDESTVLIIAEMMDPKFADVTYEQIEAAIANLNLPGFKVYVAGQGAVSGYFNKYLNLDSKRMLPLALFIMGVVVLLTFVSFKAAVGPLILVAGTAASTIGLMAWLKVPYFVITSSLPALLIAIAVADSIHLLSVYFDNRMSNPSDTHRESMSKALMDQTIPITLTSITTAIGFVVTAMFSSMPPMYYYGWFAAVGVVIAWVLTFTLLPQIVLLTRLEPSQSYARMRTSGTDKIALSMGNATRLALQFPHLVLGAVLVLAAAGIYFTNEVKFNRTQVENFRADAPIRIADSLFNSKLAGTSYLDVMVTAKAEEGMLSLEALKKVAQLQEMLQSQPGVQKTQSILNYVDTLDRAFKPSAAGQERKFPSLPEDDDAVAQYMLFLEASSDPTALRDKIDSKYQNVLVRAIFNDSSYQGTKDAVVAVRGYVERELNGPELTGTVGGRLNVDYSWMNTLESEHATGVIVSVVAIFVFCVFLFRSLFYSMLATAPVLFSVLMIYGAMGLFGVTIEPATSMFTSISLGLGVDFGIHFVHRLKKVWTDSSQLDPRGVALEVQGTARACFFNAAALGFGFAVLLFSQLPTLNRFGGLISLAAFSSFLSAMMITPALFQIFNKRSSKKSS